MLSQPRLKEILQLLLQPPVHSAADLAQRFDVTVRTIRSDIQALNRLMQGASINLKRGKGYELEIRDQATFEDWKHQALSPDWTLSLDSMEDRQRYLLSILLMHPEWQDPDDLADMIYVSRNTIQSYLRSIRNLVSRYGLVFESRGHQGVRISGPEEKRRQCLSEEVLDRNLTDYVTGFSPLEKRLFEHTDLSALSGTLYSCLQESCLTCSDYALKNLVLHTAMMLERIRAGGILPSHETETLPAEVETAANALCRTLEQNEHISICPAEQNSLALHIALNTRFSGISEREDLRTAITRMLDRIAAVWHFDLRNDPVLQKDLYKDRKSVV